jgi:predicted phage terminase large subunit-like protein
MFAGRHPTRPFIPALLADNPYLDYREYKESLSGLDPVTREQLLSGDWAVTADGRFRKSWARYYSIGHAINSESGLPEHLIMGRERRGKPLRIDNCFCFQIIDPAASAKEGPGDDKVYQNRMPSWTVISTFLLTPDFDLVWWDLRRFRGEAPEIITAMKKAYKLHSPSFIGMEYSSLSAHLYQLLKRLGFPLKPFKPGTNDKLARATDAANRMEQGKIWLPEYAPWLEDCESELFTWVGHPFEQADQIDTLAYAAMYVSTRAAEDINHTVYRFATPEAIDDATPEVFDG